MADINIDGIVTWLENWFYNKTQITGFLNNKANQSDLQTLSGTVTTLSSTVDGKVDKVTGKGLSSNDFTTAYKDKLDGIDAQANKVVVDSALSSSSENPVQNKVINTALSGKADTNHTHNEDDIELERAYPTIMKGGASTLGDVLAEIDYELDQLTGIDVVNVVTTLPSATAKTMNALYVLKTNNQYDIYITTESSGTYSWEKLDDDILSDLSIDWSDISNKPSSFTPSSHSHGYISSDGKITTGILVFSENYSPIVSDASNMGEITNGFISTRFIKNSVSLSNLGTNAQADQREINNAINTALGGKGALTDDVDWSYNSDGFTNGVKLVDKTTNANGRIILHLKS